MRSGGGGSEFDGDYTFFRTGRVYANAVCVVVNGVPNVYVDAPFEGSDLSPAT